MGTPRRQVSDRSSHQQRRLGFGIRPDIALRADWPGRNVLTSIDAHHNIGNARYYAFPGIFGQSQYFHPVQQPSSGFNQLLYPVNWRGGFMPELMPAHDFEPRLQNAQLPMLLNTQPSMFQRIEDSRRINISAPGQSDSLLADHPAPLPNQLSNQLIPDQRASLLIPDQPADQSDMVSNQAALSPDQSTMANDRPTLFLDQSTVVPDQPVSLHDQPTIVPPLIPDESIIVPDQPALLPNQLAPSSDQSAMLPDSLTDQPVLLPESTVSRNSSVLGSLSPDLSSTEFCSTANIINLEKSYPDLVFVKRKLNQKEYLEITQQDTLEVAGVGYMSPVRAIFINSDTSGVSYDIQVLLNSVQSGTVETLGTVRPLINMVSPNSNYKFCPGLEYQHYFDFYFSVIGYHIKTVRLWERPFQRVDSINCVLLHQLSHNATREEKSLYVVLCKQCKRLRNLLDHQRRRSDVSPTRKLQRQQPSSRFKLKYLSPASTDKRKRATQRERSADKSKLAKYEHLDVNLDDDQNDEWNSVIEQIEEQYNGELEKVFQEADARSKQTGSRMRTLWQSDRSAKAGFLKDQQRNRKWLFCSIAF